MESLFLKLHIESPNTLHTEPSGHSSPSSAGHVWMELVRSDGSTKQAGFAPIDPKGGMSSVAGKIYDNDGPAYSGDPHFSATFKITEGQAKSLERFFRTPEEFGFDKDHYLSLIHISEPTRLR